MHVTCYILCQVYVLCCIQTSCVKFMFYTKWLHGLFWSHVVTSCIIISHLFILVTYTIINWQHKFMVKNGWMIFILSTNDKFGHLLPPTNVLFKIKLLEVIVKILNCHDLLIFVINSSAI